MLVLALLSACGRSEGEDVADAVSGYLAAAADRDGERACGLLTRKAQRRVFRLRRAHAGLDHPAQACASVVRSFGPLYGSERLRRLEVSDIEIDGDRAAAKVDGFPVKLLKTAGRWRLTSGIAQKIGDAPPRPHG